MIWPTLIVDNFLNKPLEIKEFANKQIFTPDPEGKWPGKRSRYLHHISPQLFNSITTKIVTLLYPYQVAEESIQWNALCSFQKISPQISNQGWVHADGADELTALIYLSSHTQCGTSIYESINFTSRTMHAEKKHKMYLEKDKKMKKFQDENNNQFKETVRINSQFNRLVMFDSSNWHKANQFKEDDVDEERLTLICFFTNLRNNKTNFKQPIPSANRILI